MKAGGEIASTSWHGEKRRQIDAKTRNGSGISGISGSIGSGAPWRNAAAAAQRQRSGVAISHGGSWRRHQSYQRSGMAISGGVAARKYNRKACGGWRRNK